MDKQQEEKTARDAVFVATAAAPAGALKSGATLSEEVKGFDFGGSKTQQSVDFEALLTSYKTTGFQATSFGQAVDEINKMIRWRLSDEQVPEDEVDEYKDPKYRQNKRCTIFLGYTSNMISSGVRETIRYLVQNHMVDCIVTTAGGIEEDFIKCLAPTYVGDFHLKGQALRMEGLNRIGNLLIPNNNYVLFEDWVMPILGQMYKEQKEKGEIWSPSKIINRLGKEINNPESVYYWAWKNDIPVFCPAITDGSLGDMIYMFSFRHDEFIVDLVQDIRAINSMAVSAKKSGMIIVGGGLIKHHICNANLMRNGADFSVYLNTAQEFDGSDAGARPDEAVSWGKIKLTATPVKIYAEASLVLPLLVGMTFAKNFEPRKKP